MKKLGVLVFCFVSMLAALAVAQVGGGVYGPPALPLAGGTLTGTVKFPAGTALLPSLTGVDTATGIWFRTTAVVDVSTAGVHRFEFAGTGLRAGNGNLFCWSSTTTPTSLCDISLSRAAAGVLGVGTTGGSNAIIRANRMQFNPITNPAAAPGATLVEEMWVCGTNAGTAKKIAFAGTSATAVTLIDNVGAGVTGC